MFLLRLNCQAHLIKNDLNVHTNQIIVQKYDTNYQNKIMIFYSIFFLMIFRCGDGKELSSDGKCIDINECVWMPCLHGATCHNRHPGKI